MFGLIKFSIDVDLFKLKKNAEIIVIYITKTIWHVRIRENRSIIGPKR